MWLKSHAQVGLCYRRMREHQAAIQAFRTALNDPSASPNDGIDVLYFLGQSLEFTGQIEEALEIYGRVDQLNPGFANVADRVRGLRQSLGQTSLEKEPAMSNSSWLGGAIRKLWRSLTGGRK